MISKLHAVQFAADDVQSMSDPANEEGDARVYATRAVTVHLGSPEGTRSGKELVSKSEVSDSEEEGNEEIMYEGGSPLKKQAAAISVVEQEETNLMEKTSTFDITWKGSEQRTRKCVKHPSTIPAEGAP
jgi:hypothetical protein